MEKTLNSISTYSIILLPILLITGPFLSDLSIFLVDIIFLTILFKNKEKDLKKKIFYFNVLVVFNVYISLVSLFAEDIHMSLKSSLFYIRFGIYIFALNYFLKKIPKLLIIFHSISGFYLFNHRCSFFNSFWDIMSLVFKLIMWIK